MYQRFKSFVYALRGIRYALQEEPNFRAECLIALLVIFLMFLFPVSTGERVLLVVAIFLVLVMELVNTAERTMDILKPRVHPYVRTVKDVMAGAVLITTLGAAAMGLFIFWPFFAPLLP
jgi:undecaprenol kinase